MSASDSNSVGRNDVDGVFLGWAFLWSLVLMITVAAMLAGDRATDLPMQQQFSVGLALGGLSAIWAAIGSWVNLIELPAIGNAIAREDQPRDTEPVDSKPVRQPQQRQQQRHAARFQVGAILVLSVVAMGFAIRHDPQSIAQVALAALFAVAIVVVVMQWTGRRLHRGLVGETGQRSIRQIMHLTTTIALLVAIFKLTNDKIGLSDELFAMVVSLGGLWLALMFLLLGRYWWLLFISVPLLVVQLMAISFFFDSQSRNLESDLSRFSGTVVGFYVLAILVLGLMRSSGHRWFGRRR
ncbi:hypothetical protein U8335_14410 [Roseiconus lacunae]|uniref:hypothetical protein n=1 Tax=Roseiconus lacunae TaxID=2605694 RepID=UPI00308D908E|nr:hypothetical protein U8335_14410 [Stieleria sp. HD01]